MRVGRADRPAIDPDTADLPLRAAPHRDDESGTCALAKALPRRTTVETRDQPGRRGTPTAVVNPAWRAIARRRAIPGGIQATPSATRPTDARNKSANNTHCNQLWARSVSATTLRDVRLSGRIIRWPTREIVGHLDLADLRLRPRAPQARGSGWLRHAA